MQIIEIKSDTSFAFLLMMCPIFFIQGGFYNEKNQDVKECTMCLLLHSVVCVNIATESFRPSTGLRYFRKALSHTKNFDNSYCKNYNLL